MLEFIRKHQRLVLIVIVILVLPSFIFFGVRDYQGFMSNDVKLAQVNKISITKDQFHQEWRNRLDQLRLQGGDSFDMSQVDIPNNRRLWLDQLINNAVLQEVAINENFSASDNMVVEAIAEDPQFQNTDGKFNLEKYTAFLTGNKIKAEDYQNRIRYFLSLDAVVQKAVRSYVVPQAVSQALTKKIVQQRSVRLRKFKAESFFDQLDNITDADLQSWYEQHKEEFKIPHHVDAEYILLNQDAALQGINEPSEAEIEQYYKANAKRFIKPERRLASHIQISIPTDATPEKVVEIQQKAQKIADEAKQDPTKFAALVKEYSDDLGTKNIGGQLGLVKQGDIAVLDTAIFNNKAAGVYDPVRVGNAFHIIKVSRVDAESTNDIASHKDDIIKEIKLQLAAEKFADMATKLTQVANDERNSLQPVQEQLQLPIQHIEGVAQNGLINQQSQDKNVALFANSRVREALFSNEVLNQKLNSAVIELSPSELMVVRVVKDIPAAVPELASVKDKVLAQIKLSKGNELAKQAADKFLEQLKTNSVAAEGFAPAIEVSRLFQSNLPDSQLNSIMQANVDKLPSYVDFALPDGYAVARIESVKEGDEQISELFKKQVLPNLMAGAQQTLSREIMLALRDQVKVKVNDDAVKQLIEGDQED